VELWKFPTRGAVDSSPVIAGDRLVVASDDGRVYSLSLADGSELWHYEIGSPVAGSPAVVEGSFLIGADDGNLYAFSVKKAAPAPSVKRQDLAGPVRGWRRDGTGIFPDSDPLTEWDEKKNVRWRTMVGASHSSPVVSGDRVFVTSEKSTLCCLDRKTGKTVWSKTHGIDDVPGEFKKSLQESLNGSPTAGFAVPTPICDGQNVFVVFGSGVVACYDMIGNCKWIRCIEPSGLTYGHTSSPLLADGKLIVSLAGFAALDLQSGKTIWENNEIEQAYGSPVLMKLGQSSVIITPTGYVVRPSDGKILARDIASGLSGDEFSISPIVQNDIVYYINRECSAVKLTLTAGQVSAKTLWTTDLEESAFASPVFYEGLIFACGKTGHYTVLDASNGSKILEKVLQLAPAGGADPELANAIVYPSLSIAGEKLFIGNDQGQTFVLKPAKDYVEVHRNRLPEGSGACPVVDGKDLFLRSGDYLYCIGR
jgi:outer membrane protein assembly factor BamB